MSPSRLRRIMARYPNVRDYDHWVIRVNVAGQFRAARREKNLAWEFTAPKAEDARVSSRVQGALSVPVKPEWRDTQEPWAGIRRYMRAMKRNIPNRAMVSLPLP